MLSRYFAAVVAAAFLAYFAPLAAQSIGTSDDARGDSGPVQQRAPAGRAQPVPVMEFFEVYEQ